MKIKQLRKMNGLSQSAFAKKLGIAQNTLSQYETGQRKVPPELLRKISDAYNTTTDYLLDADQICDDRLGPALKDERQFQKLSLKQVSIDTKIPLKDLSNYENNLEPVNLYIFKILCKYFGKSTYEFYNDHEMYDEYIPEIFNGDVDKYEAFKNAVDLDAQKELAKTHIAQKNRPKNLIKDYLEEQLKNEKDNTYQIKNQKCAAKLTAPIEKTSVRHNNQTLINAITDLSKEDSAFIVRIINGLKHSKTEQNLSHNSYDYYPNLTATLIGLLIINSAKHSPSPKQTYEIVKQMYSNLFQETLHRTMHNLNIYSPNSNPSELAKDLCVSILRLEYLNPHIMPHDSYSSAEALSQEMAQLNPILYRYQKDENEQVIYVNT